MNIEFRSAFRDQWTLKNTSFIYRKKKMQLLLFILLALSGLPRRHVAMKDAEIPQQ